MKTYTIQELRNAPIQIKVYSEAQAIKLAYAVGHKTDWKPYKAKYPIYCYLDKNNFPTWNSSENERKLDKPTIIEFNQIKNFMIDYTIKGTKLPTIPEYIMYRCPHWHSSVPSHRWELNDKNYVSFGSTEYKDEVWVLAEREDYSGVSYFMFKLTDLQKLTDNNMKNKEIIGYKLIKKKYADAALKIEGSRFIGTDIKQDQILLAKYTESVKRLKEAGVLDLWFEPVYEEEYKVGDWITITEVEGAGWLNYCSQRTFKLEKAPTSYCGGIYWGVNEGGLHAKFRKATPEEIEAAQKQIIKMYSSNKGEFEIEVVDGKAYYRPEGKELPKEWVAQIIELFQVKIYSKTPYNLTTKIDNIKVGCMEGTKKEDWINVYKLLK